MSLRMWARLALIAFGAIIVQVGLLNQVVVSGAHADVFLLLAISAGLVAGPQRGAAMAFVLGLVADVFVPTPYGLSSLCYVLVAFAVGLATSAAARTRELRLPAFGGPARRGRWDAALRRPRGPHSASPGCLCTSSPSSS